MTSELTKALCGFYKDVSVIHKDAKAQYGKFADLASVLTAVTPALAKNGLACPQTFEPAAEGQEPFLITTLCHTSGETIQSRLPMVVGKGRNVLHDFGGSVTYLRRYALLAILGLAADVDTDGDLGEPAPVTKSKPSPAPQPKAAKKQEAPASADLPLSADDRKLLLTCMQELTKDNLGAVIAAFRKEFSLSDDAKVSNEITTEQHAEFLRAQLARY